MPIINHFPQNDSATKELVNTHITDKENPHGVTAAQVGAIPTKSGKSGQLLGFTADNVIGAVNAPSSGVTSFKGRTGAIQPASGDYTAAQVGARPSNWMPTAANVGALPITGGTLTGNLTLKGSNNYGTKINFGDGDYVHLYEISDDKLEIKASNLDLTVSGKATYKGKELSTKGVDGPISLTLTTSDADVIQNYSCYYKASHLVFINTTVTISVRSTANFLYIKFANAPAPISSGSMYGLHVTNEQPSGASYGYNIGCKTQVYFNSNEVILYVSRENGESFTTGNDYAVEFNFLYMSKE